MNTDEHDEQQKEALKKAREVLEQDEKDIEQIDKAIDKAHKEGQDMYKLPRQ